MIPALYEVLRHRKEVCWDCGCEGLLVDAVTCDGDGVVIVRLPSGGGTDVLVPGTPGRMFLTIGGDGSDPLCCECARERIESSLEAAIGDLED